MFSRLLNFKEKRKDRHSSPRNRAADQLARVLIIGDTTIDDYLSSIYMNAKNLVLDRSKVIKDLDLLLKKKEYHLILVGIEDNAIEILNLIRQSENTARRIPVIAIEPPKDRKQLITSLSNGFDDFLVKPVKKTDIENILTRWLGDISLKASDISLEADKNIAANIEKRATPDTIKKTVDIEESLKYSHQNNELARDLLLLLIKSIKSEKNKAINLYRNNEWEALGELAHKLNGGSCYCGVPALQEKTKAMEKAVNTKNYSEIETVFPQLIRAMDELIQWNEAYDLDVIFNLE